MHFFIPNNFGLFQTSSIKYFERTEQKCCIFQKTTFYKSTEQRTCRLWEFLRDLLCNPQYNPEVIKWSNREKGEFKLVKSGEIAKMWGIRKNNNGMTYEKLSRALRQVTPMVTQLTSDFKSSYRPFGLVLNFFQILLQD